MARRQRRQPFNPRAEMLGTGLRIAADGVSVRVVLLTNNRPHPRQRYNMSPATKKEITLALLLLLAMAVYVAWFCGAQTN